MDTIPVKYIGPDAHWHGLLYNTRLRFEHGQTLQLPTELGLKFLTHHDTFGPGEEPTKPQAADPSAETALAEAGKQQEQDKQQQVEVFEVFDQIDRMDKNALATFSKKYGQDIDKRKGLAVLRADAKSFVDRFGAI